MKRTSRNQIFDQRGNLIAEETVETIVYKTADESLIAAARLIVLPKIAADELKDADAEQFAGLFPDWEPGIAVKVGEVWRWDGTLVECIQAHTTQADWAPDKVPALFKVHRKPGAVAWVDGASYKVGDVVTFGGNRYECRQAHTAHLGAGWTPVAYAAGWISLGPI